MNMITCIPRPIIREEGVSVWQFEDLQIIYVETTSMWFTRDLDVAAAKDAHGTSNTLLDAFLAYYNTSTDKLLTTLDN